MTVRYIIGSEGDIYLNSPDMIKWMEGTEELNVTSDVKNGSRVAQSLIKILIKNVYQQEKKEAEVKCSWNKEYPEIGVFSPR